MVGIAAGHRMVLQLAEAARKCHMLCARDVLVAEEEHAVPEQQRTDLRHQCVVLGCGGQAHVAELGTDGASQWLDLDRVAQRCRAHQRGCRFEALSHDVSGCRNEPIDDAQCGLGSVLPA